MLHPLLPSQVEALYHQLIRQPKQETLCHTWWRRQEKELHPLLPSQVETLNHQLIRQLKQETLCPYLAEAAGEGAPHPPPQPGRDSLSSADRAVQILIAADWPDCPAVDPLAG